MKMGLANLAIPVICVAALAVVVMEFIPMLKMTSAIVARLSFF